MLSARKILSLILIPLALSSSSCTNFMEDFSSKDSDEAIYNDAVTLMNAQEWDAAIDKFEELSPGYASRSEVVENWAGTLAGKCGLRFFDVVTALGNGGQLLQAAMDSFTGKEVDTSACLAAQAKMEELGMTPSSRTTSQNFFMLILGLGKVGAFLHADADRNGTSNFGDGSMDAGFDACEQQRPSPPFPAQTPPAMDNPDGQFSDNELNQIVTGFGMILTNFAAISASLSGTDAGQVLADLEAQCAAIVPNPCNVTDPNTVDAQTRFALATMIHSGPATTEIQVGIGGCSGSLATCCGQ